jgi:hypothetical protein
MADLSDIDRRIRSGCRTGTRASRPEERAIAELAARQHGVVTRGQLMALGFGAGRSIDGSRAGACIRSIVVFYAVGHPRLGSPGHWMAAVLACGPGALLSHRSAAALWGLLSTASSHVDVTAPDRRGRGRPGIVLHRVRRLHPDDRALRDRIPVTAIARTLLDLAEVLNPRRLASVFEAAERLGLLDIRALVALYERSPGRRGLQSLGALLSEARDPPNTRSALERRFVELCFEEKLPPPALNVAVVGFEVDALWPRQRLIVELDGYAYHRTRGAFERDRIRDAHLQLAGYQVLRVTSRRLEHEPAVVAQTVRSLLARSVR